MSGKGGNLVKLTIQCGVELASEFRGFGDRLL
jgi:hypothetical protein